MGLLHDVSCSSRQESFTDIDSDPVERPQADTLLRRSPFCQTNSQYNFLDTELYAKIRGESDCEKQLRASTNLLQVHSSRASLILGRGRLGVFWSTPVQLRVVGHLPHGRPMRVETQASAQ